MSSARWRCCVSGAWPQPPGRPIALPTRAWSASYIHMGGKVGAMVEVNCETDFVARTDQFQKLVRDIAMQVVALHAEYPTVESIPEDVLEARRAEILADPATQGKPEAVRAKIVDGQLRKWHEQVVLTEQPFRDTEHDRRRADHTVDRHDW